MLGIHPVLAEDPSASFGSSTRTTRGLSTGDPEELRDLSPVPEKAAGATECGIVPAQPRPITALTITRPPSTGDTNHQRITLATANTPARAKAEARPYPVPHRSTDTSFAIRRLGPGSREPCPDAGSASSGEGRCGAETPGRRSGLVDTAVDMSETHDTVLRRAPHRCSMRGHLHLPRDHEAGAIWIQHRPSTTCSFPASLTHLTHSFKPFPHGREGRNSPGWTRTNNPPVNKPPGAEGDTSALSWLYHAPSGALGPPKIGSVGSQIR